MARSYKRNILILIILFKSITGFADVIFFPHQYAVFCYSAEFTTSLEKTFKPKVSRVLWAGIGCVGSFYYFNQPSFGLELAYERRYYFKPDSYEHLFISSYIGAALMSDFKYAHDIGIVPGLKLNYKAQISKKLFAEPYISLSIPIMYDFKEKIGFFPIPVFTIGARIGLIKLRSKTIKT